MRAFCVAVLILDSHRSESCGSFISVSFHISPGINDKFERKAEGDADENGHFSKYHKWRFIFNKL